VSRENTVKADYLVATVPINSVQPEQLNVFEEMTIDGQFRRFFGYAGYMKDNFYIGDNGSRLLIQATGSKADHILPLIETGWSGLSVARLDIQLTILVADADSVVCKTMPSAAYKSVRMVNLSERGSTLYVGSSKSRCRLRMYNKTAEAGEELVAGMERLRIELQTRDDYADRCLINMRAGSGDMFFRYYVSRMTDGFITNLIDRAFKHSDMLAMVDIKTDKSDESRKVWLEHTVLPALAKLSVSDKDYVKDFLHKVKDLLD
jgi:hypothetical protein